MTLLNGWQRLWVLAATLWAVAVLLVSGILQAGGNPSVQSILFSARLWMVPVAAAYGFGLGVAWVRRGFRAEPRWSD